MDDLNLKVKICGIRNLEDALVAAEAGDDFIGIVFVPGRHRRITPKEAKVIIEGVRNSSGPGPRIVGLFADQAIEEVAGIVDFCRLDFAQLCGKESVEYAGQTGCDVIKVVHVIESASVVDDADISLKVKEYSGGGHLVTLDRYVEGIQGGTGKGFNWEVAASLALEGNSFLLAGGLSPNNVADAISIVKPWGVDVSSGVETDGKKDHIKIKEFMRIAKEADAKLT